MNNAFTKTLLLIVLLFTVSCAGTAGKSSTTSYLKKGSKKQNSYYYFMMSQLLNSPETVDDSDALLDMALKKDKESAFLWSQKAIAAARHSKWEEGLRYAKKSVVKDPSNTATLILLGKLHAAKNEPKKAIAYYRKALGFNKRLEELYNVMAREYLTLKSKGSAIHSLRMCLKELPEAMSCRYYLATIYLEGKEYNQALRHFQMLQQLDPENPKILQTIGDIYLQKKAYKKALGIFGQLKKLYPQDPTYYIRSGLTYYELKQVDEAIQEFEGVIKKFPRSDRINYFLGLLYMEKKNNDKAYGYLNRIGSASPLFKESLSRLLYILREKNDILGAVNLIDKKISRKNQTTESYNLKVSLLIHAASYKRGLQEVNEAIVQFGDDEKLLFQRAIILDRLGRWKEAKKDLIAVIAQNPESDGTLNYLGYTMLERGDDIEEASKYILKAVRLKPNDGHVTDSLGWLYYKKGKHQKALIYLHRANRQRPNEPAILGHLGDVYFELKNKRKSRVYYQKAMKLLEKRKRKSPEEKKMMNSLKEKLGKF